MDHESKFTAAPTNIRAMYRVLASPDELPLFSETTPGLSGESDLPQGHGLSEAVAAFLVDLSRKMDHVISLLTTDRLAEEFPGKAQVSEISGAWAVIRSDGPLAQGQHLEMVFVLSRMPLSLAGAVGRVTAARQKGDGYDARIEFTSIRSSDQEALVQFVFHEQRQQIRAAKWE